jgi:RES domain-containing protein
MAPHLASRTRSGGRYPIFDLTGAAAYGVLWNSPGGPVIHAAVTYAAAMFELLLNPAHPDFPMVRATAPSPVVWDRRLFSLAGCPIFGQEGQ